MNVFLKVDSLGNSIGDNLSLSSNAGSITPNVITKNQFLAGVNVSVDNSSTEITISSSGQCNRSITIPIVECTSSTGGNINTSPAPTATITPTATLAIDGCDANALDPIISRFIIKYTLTGECAEFKQSILDDFPNEEIFFRQSSNSSYRYLDYCGTKLYSFGSDDSAWSRELEENPTTCPEIIRVKAKLYHPPIPPIEDRPVQYFEINELDTPPENQIPTEYYSIAYSTWGPPGSAADEADCAACV
jgi:hypothetical protein